MFSLPLFPLPNVVLFPNVFLPLHIFEPRYRQMVAESLSGDRIIGMVMLKPGYEADYEGRPPIYATGCSGLITHVERLDDGRYNLVLRGLEKFTVHSEEAPSPGRLYRTAVVAPHDEPIGDADLAGLPGLRLQLLKALTPAFSGTIEARLPEAMPDADLVNALAQYLEFEPAEKLALLQQPGPVARARAMLDLLEMKALLPHRAGGSVH